MDRLVLKGQYPSLKAVILPPAFEGTPYCCYILAPPVPSVVLYGTRIPRMKIAQRITATMPLWEQVRMIVQNTVTPFLLRVGGEYQSVVPQFRMPLENPLCDVGAGWHMVSTEPGRELAVRRCPLMHHDVGAAGGHPYFYAVSGRPHPERSLWTVSVVTPHQADFAFPDVDLWDYIPQLDQDEEQHEEGFVLRSN